jgi:site-specific DNA recombinase
VWEENVRQHGVAYDIYREELKEFLYADKEGSDYQAHIQIRLQEKQALLETTGSEYRKLEADMQELVAMRVRKELNAEDFTRHYQPLKNRFEQLGNPLSEVQAQIDYLAIQAASAGAVIAEARDLYQRWPDLPFVEKRSIVDAITDAIIIGGETIQIKLAYVPPAHTPSPQNSTNNQRDESHWFVVS